MCIYLNTVVWFLGGTVGANVTGTARMAAGLLAQFFSQTGSKNGSSFKISSSLSPRAILRLPARVEQLGTRKVQRDVADLRLRSAYLLRKLYRVWTGAKERSDHLEIKTPPRNSNSQPRWAPADHSFNYQDKAWRKQYTKAIAE